VKIISNAQKILLATLTESGYDPLRNLAPVSGLKIVLREKAWKGQEIFATLHWILAEIRNPGYLLKN